MRSRDCRSEYEEEVICEMCEAKWKGQWRNAGNRDPRKIRPSCAIELPNKSTYPQRTRPGRWFGTDCRERRQIRSRPWKEARRETSAGLPGACRTIPRIFARPSSISSASSATCACSIGFKWRAVRRSARDQTEVSTRTFTSASWRAHA